MAPLIPPINQIQSLRELFESFPDIGENLKRSFLNGCESSYHLRCEDWRQIRLDGGLVRKRCESHLNYKYPPEEAQTLETLKNTLSVCFQNPTAYYFTARLLGEEVMEDSFTPENEISDLVQSSQKTCEELSSPNEEVGEVIFLDPEFERDQTSNRFLSNSNEWKTTTTSLLATAGAFTILAIVGIRFGRICALKKIEKTVEKNISLPVLARLNVKTANDNGYANAALLLVSLSSYILI